MAVRSTRLLLTMAVMSAGCGPGENARQAVAEAGADANAAERDAAGAGGGEAGFARDVSVIGQDGAPSETSAEAAAPVQPCTAGATDDAGVAVDGAPGPTPQPGPSCMGLCDTCGPTANENCCTSLLVPGGSFYRSYDGVMFTDPSFPATVSTFWLDKYEVTGGRWANFNWAWFTGWRPAAGAGKHTHLNGGSGLANSAEPGFESGWDPAWDRNATPIGGVGLEVSPYPYRGANWYEAYAFCIWDGGFLPSEAEWNYAAAGGAEQRVYPWSVPPSSTVLDNTRVACNVGFVGCSYLPVGYTPAGNGRWGHADLAGSVDEWTLDAYLSPYVVPCDNCSHLVSDPSTRVARGGDITQLLFDFPDRLSTSFRHDVDPMNVRILEMAASGSASSGRRSGAYDRGLRAAAAPVAQN